MFPNVRVRIWRALCLFNQYRGRSTTLVVISVRAGLPVMRGVNSLRQSSSAHTMHVAAQCTMFADYKAHVQTFGAVPLTATVTKKNYKQVKSSEIWLRKV
ncbi:hypothetical protein TNCT_108141 [Trichonephila clavata]|uniref:Uncharacterized protein n=1 Tax=Trichonephila clavata TaxID=2740835 RepID=A0A8X6I2N7_TRICU|nr:hypothetical protein TNCT_108141 [Trichonephila clavata]